MTNDELARAINSVRNQRQSVASLLWTLERLDEQLTQELEERIGKHVKEIA